MCTHSHTQTQTLCRFTVVYILLHQYFWTGTLASAGVTIKIETLMLFFFFFCCFSISPIPLQTASLLWACNGSVTHIYLLTSLGLVHCNLLELDMFCVCAWCREREREREKEREHIIKNFHVYNLFYDARLWPTFYCFRRVFYHCARSLKLFIYMLLLFMVCITIFTVLHTCIICD